MMKLLAVALVLGLIACKNQLTVQSADRVVDPSNNKTIEKVYEYESFANDPMKARVYTLDNGLKVYYLFIRRNREFKLLLLLLQEVKMTLQMLLVLLIT